MLISHHPSIPFVAFLSISHLSHWILLFSSPSGRLPFSPCIQTILTHCALLDQLTHVKPVILRTSSFLTWSTCVTPHILLRHLVSITFNLFFSVTAILHVSAPYDAIGTVTPSYNLFYIYIPIALQPNIFIPPNTFLT